MAVVSRAAQLQARGLKQMAGVTGDIEDASRYARHFSPESNRAQDKGSPSYVLPAEELRVLVATAPGRRQHVGIVRFRRRGKARARVMMCLRASLVKALAQTSLSVRWRQNSTNLPHSRRFRLEEKPLFFTRSQTSGCRASARK